VRHSEAGMGPGRSGRGAGKDYVEGAGVEGERGVLAHEVEEAPVVEKAILGAPDHKLGMLQPALVRPACRCLRSVTQASARRIPPMLAVLTFPQSALNAALAGT
jgi:hypothetical protein